MNEPDFGQLASLFSNTVHSDAETQIDAELNPEIISSAVIPFFPSDVAAVPTELMRTALFGITGRRARKKLNEVKINSRKDISVIYSGEELGQDDLDIWCCLLQLIRYESELHIRSRELIVKLNRQDGTKTRHWLFSSLRRMAKAFVDVDFKLQGKLIHISSSLLSFSSITGVDEKNSYFIISIPFQAQRLFNNLTYMPWEKRLCLRSEVSKAVLAYACSHQRGRNHKIRIELLQHWLNGNKRLDRFKSALDRALTELVEAKVIKQIKYSKNNHIESVEWVLI